VGNFARAYGKIHACLAAGVALFAAGVALSIFLAGARAAEAVINIAVSGHPGVHRIYIPVGHAQTIDLNEDIGELAVADGKIADSQPMTNRTLYIEAKAIGTTTISMFSAEKKSLGVINVEVGSDMASVRQSIREIAPGSRVAATPVNGRIRLSGSVPDVLTMNKVLDVVAQYGNKSDIINSMTLGDAQQVNLHVRILEVNRTAGRELGINWAFGPVSLNRPGNTAGGIGTNILNGTPNADVPGTGTTFATIIANVLTSGALGNVDVMINALEKKGLVRTLAEPNLTTLSGEPARFLAGGQVPIRTTTPDGQVTITYKDFGVKLQFTPLVLDDKKIQMNIQPEVSDISQFTPAGDPVFNTRNLDTTVQLRSGQSFALAGLLQNNNRKIQNQVPWIGQIPVLGTLFRSTSYQKQETELVVIVTPQLARPSPPDEHLATPFDKTRPSNDPEFFLLGQLEVTKDMIRKYELGEGVVGPFGHILDAPPDKLVYVKK
jgi:pilus assembly protein CpaC